MSEENTPQTNQPSTPLRAMDVMHFLQKHPGFFSQYPDLLAQLQVVDESGAVTNLVNYQVKVLQEKNHQLAEQLKAVMAAARSSEQLLDKVFELALKLSTAGPDRSCLNTFVEHVGQAFPSDFLALAIDAGQVPPDTRMQHVRLISDPEEFRQLFADALDQPEPVCGRIKADKREYLFGDAADEVASVALIPLGESASSGLLAFGSRDEHRFQPGMATDILQKLARLLRHKLQHDQQRVTTQSQDNPIHG